MASSPSEYSPRPQRASLSEEVLRGANLSLANLHSANLCGVDLCEADLCEANFCEANLIGAHLCGADLCGAHLVKANLNEADLSEANFSHANLNKADLQDVNLQTANLINSNLEGANLTGALLWETQRSGWKLKDIVCENVYWDEEGSILEVYGPGEFERVFSQNLQIELIYENGISLVEIAMLPHLIEKVQNKHQGLEIRLRSIEEVGIKSKARIIIDDNCNRATESLNKELESIEEELKRRPTEDS